MQRRHFFRNGTLALLGSTLVPRQTRAADYSKNKIARNIIFMVSDGMSTGTLNMADLLLQRRDGKRSTWMQLYDEQRVARALMDTASASSLITDSAAGSSSWGGGVRVNNGSLNVNANGSQNQPILQKFKAMGKAVGCVTTVPITHATPAGFSICNNKRGDQEEIATQYLPLKFDVMMGGGLQYFKSDTRRDKQDMLAQYRQKGYDVVLDKQQLQNVTGQRPVLGVFADDGLPYSLDRQHDEKLSHTTPTLAEMAEKAIRILSKNKNGFVMQVEAGKVDWAAHANDIGALLFEQVAFDEAVKVAIDFAAKNEDTLVVITTDHGNANPGLFYGDNANQNFDHTWKFRQTNDWVLNQLNRNHSVRQVIDTLAAAQDIILKEEEASQLLQHYSELDENGIYNPRKLPFKFLADLQRSHTSVGWGSMDHSADFVELAMYGPGTHLLKPFVKNTDLHNLMLEAAGAEIKKR